MIKLGTRFLFVLISFYLVISAPAQVNDGGISDDLQQRLANLKDSPISLPAQIQTGRTANAENAAIDIGVKEISGVGMEGPDAVVASLYASVGKLEAERNAVIAGIRKKEFFGRLGKSFLNAVFDKKALDPASGQFLKDYDKAFVRARAADNDIASVTEWRLIRDLLQSGEMVLLDDAKLQAGGKVRPPKFDQLYPTYREAAGKLMADLRKFDQTLPAKVGAVQKKIATEYFESYADQVASLKEDSLAALGAVKVALESEKLRDVIVSHLGAGVSTEGLTSKPGSAKPVPSSTKTPAASPRDNIIPATVGPPRGPITFPLPDPKSLPPLPNMRCRIVVVKMPDADPEISLKAYEAVERDDYTDVVKLGRKFCPWQCAGNPVGWSACVVG